jgi:hypothetical protein
MPIREEESSISLDVDFRLTADSLAPFDKAPPKSGDQGGN